MPAAHLEDLFDEHLPILDLHFPPGTQFDSHDFIQKLTQANQQLYIQALSHYGRSRAPFQKLHNQLSRLLKSRGLNVRHTGERDDDNIFGESVRIYTWERY
jgi:hypothetical protein